MTTPRRQSPKRATSHLPSRSPSKSAAAKSRLQLVGRHSAFDRFAGSVTRMAGSSWAFAIALGSVVVWALSGPLFGFSEDWQMVINTGTTIVTFLMVFLIQQSQNKDSVAVHIKLNELLASHERASNHLIAAEDLDEHDLATLREFYCELAILAKEDKSIRTTHSLDDAVVIHETKSKALKKAPKKARATEAVRSAGVP
jgi:low affinity Fe/Cu permease